MMFYFRFIWLCYHCKVSTMGPKEELFGGVKFFFQNNIWVRKKFGSNVRLSCGWVWVLTKSYCKSQNWRQIYICINSNVWIPKIQGEYLSSFPKPVQECVPRGLLEARSWRSSWNAFLGCFQEHFLKKIKKLCKASWRGEKQILTLCFCCRGGGVK